MGIVFIIFEHFYLNEFNLKTEHIYFISYSHVHTTGHITFRTSRYCENLMICLNTIVFFCFLFLNKVFKIIIFFFLNRNVLLWARVQNITLASGWQMTVILLMASFAVVMLVSLAKYCSLMEKSLAYF